MSLISNILLGAYLHIYASVYVQYVSQTFCDYKSTFMSTFFNHQFNYSLTQLFLAAVKGIQLHSCRLSFSKKSSFLQFYIFFWFLVNIVIIRKTKTKLKLIAKRKIIGCSIIWNCMENLKYFNNLFFCCSE